MGKEMPSKKVEVVIDTHQLDMGGYDVIPLAIKHLLDQMYCDGALRYPVQVTPPEGDYIMKVVGVKVEWTPTEAEDDTQGGE